MFFADYIQKLHKIVAKNQSKANFTKETLKRMITNENVIEYSESSYKYFFCGKKSAEDKRVIGDTIQRCAQSMIPFLDESAAKFCDYMNSLQFNTSAKDALCNAFRDEIPDINPDNYSQKLGLLLCQIIKDAASAENTTNNAGQHDAKDTGESNQEPLDPVKPEQLQKLVDSLVSNLNQIRRKWLSIREAYYSELDLGGFGKEAYYGKCFKEQAESYYNAFLESNDILNNRGMFSPEREFFLRLEGLSWPIHKEVEDNMRSINPLSLLEHKIQEYLNQLKILQKQIYGIPNNESPMTVCLDENLEQLLNIPHNQDAIETAQEEQNRDPDKL